MKTKYECGCSKAGNNGAKNKQQVAHLQWDWGGGGRGMKVKINVKKQKKG